MLILFVKEKSLNGFRNRARSYFVGVTAYYNDEYILPMHRNLGVFTGRNIPLYRLFSQWQGKANGFTKGRDRSFHFGTQQYKNWNDFASWPQLGLMESLANKLKKNGQITAVLPAKVLQVKEIFMRFIASVWELPVMFVIENNGYGLSTPTNEQYRCENLADKGKDTEWKVIL
jgi:2-oxoisovalerate dehydrogenase E1 component